jgi:hypothetical protein
VLGFYYTSSAWKDIAASRRQVFFVVAVGVSLVSFALLIVGLATLGVEWATQSEVVAAIRRFLLSAPIVMNGLFGIVSGVCLFFLASAVIVLSPHMKKGA